MRLWSPPPPPTPASLAGPGQAALAAPKALLWQVLRAILFVLGAVLAATALSAVLSHLSASASESHPTPGGGQTTATQPTHHTTGTHQAGEHQAPSRPAKPGHGSAAVTHPAPTGARPATHGAARTTPKPPPAHNTPIGTGHPRPAGRRPVAAPTPSRATHSRPVAPIWPTRPGHVWGANPPTWPPRPAPSPVHPITHPPVSPVWPLPPVWHPAPVQHLPITWPIQWPVRQPVGWPWGPGRLDHGPVIRHQPTHTTSSATRTAAGGDAMGAVGAETLRQARPAAAAAPVTRSVAAQIANGVRPASFPPPDPGAPPRRVPGKPVYKRMVPRDAIVAAARRIETGHGPGWHRGRHVPYAWDAGHGRRPGPTYGSAGGEGSSVDAHTYGVDCSGFTRWVYSIAYHHDLLGRNGSDTNAQIHTLRRDPHRHPGDLVFFGGGVNSTVHVGVYIGHGRMIDAPETGENVKTQPVSAGGHIVGFYRGPAVRVRVRSTQRLTDHHTGHRSVPVRAA